MKTDFDVIVIGGGPAGSTVSWYLNRMGHRVLVLEKEKFPRFHVGESLLPYNNEIFRDMGLLEKMEAGGFMVKRGAQFHVSHHPTAVQFRFAKGRWTEHPASWQVERAVFDKMLLDHVIEAGVTVREETRVGEYRVENGGVSVVSTGPGGGKHEHTAKFLVDATGMANFSGNREGLQQVFRHHRKLAVFGHFTGVKMPDGESRGDIVLTRFPKGWCWMIPLSDSKTSVGMVVDSASAKACHGDKDALFAAAVAENGKIMERMDGAVMIDHLHAVSDFSYVNRRLVSPRLLRAGDAAGFLDPVFSSGVFLAMETGRRGAGAIHKTLQAGVGYSRDLARYEEETRRKMDLYWQMIESYYTHPFTEVFLHPEERFHIVSAVNAVLAGRTRLPFAARLRLKAFYLVVRLQKYLPLVPRLQGVNYDARTKPEPEEVSAGGQPQRV
jgi:FADH2-dependent halogenase